MLLLLAATPASGQTASTEGNSLGLLGVDPFTGEPFSAEEIRAARLRVDEAVQALTEEARRLYPVRPGVMGDANEVSFRVSRPHPAVASWPREQGLITLTTMDRRFAGVPHQDAYVRYHLLPHVTGTLEIILANRPDEPLDDAIVSRLIDQINRLPSDRIVGVEPRDRREPRELWQRFYSLRNSTAIRVGTPPYDEVFFEGRALSIANSEARKQQIRDAMAQMAEIRPQLRSEIDHESRRYNSRVGNFNRAAFQSYNDIAFLLARSGASLALDKLVEEMAELVNDRQRTGYDLLEALYVATLEGVMATYDPDEVRRLASQLERLANRHRDYTRIKIGSAEHRGQQGVRSFYDAAFHLVNLLREPRALGQFAPRGAIAPTPRATAAARRDLTPDDVSVEDIRAAIDRAVNAINLAYTRPASRLHPEIEVETDAGSQRNLEQDLIDDEIELSGHTLLAWALLASGESYQDPRLFQRINYVASRAPYYTFNRAFRLNMLRFLPRDAWRPWVQRDATWIQGALRPQAPVRGGFPERFAGNNRDPADNSQSFYGVLGLWAAQEAGVNVDRDAWALVDYHWRNVQQRTPDDRPAGWARGLYNQNNADPPVPGGLRYSGSPDALMTAAGAFALTLTERYLGDLRDRNSPLVPPGVTGNELDKGLRWLQNNHAMSGDLIPAEWYYRMWLMQRLALATGIREFNGIDWVRDVTVEMIRRQRSNGLWPGDEVQPTTVTSAFSLLYLGTVLQPVAVSKLQLADAAWDNHPRDLLNFAGYASDQYEVATTWQIVTPDTRARTLQDSPMLFLSTDDAFELTPAQVQNLRRYVDHGGLLVTNAESGQEELRAFRTLYQRLFPEVQGDAGEGVPLSTAPRDHEIFTLHRTVASIPYVQMVDNGVRTLAVHFPRDIGQALDRNDRLRSDAFAMMSNLYLYSVGYDPRRTRLETRIVPADPRATTSRRVAAARVRHGGNFDPEPFFAAQVAALARNDVGIDLVLETRDAADLKNAKLAILSTTGDVSDPVDDRQAADLRAYVERGGTLWVEAAGGGQAAVEAARRVVRDVMPEGRLDPLPNTSPILSGLRDANGRLVEGFDATRVRYRFYALRRMQPSAQPRLQAVYVGGRPAIILSEEDITSGVTGLEHWGIFGYDVPSARKLMLNGLLAAAAAGGPDAN